MERYLTKTEKIAAFREKYLPVWVILPLISIFVLNCLIYWGSGVLTADRYHSLSGFIFWHFLFGQWIIFWLHREEKMDFIGLWFVSDDFIVAFIQFKIYNQICGFFTPAFLQIVWMHLKYCANSNRQPYNKF